jgi:CBS domain-containing protein
MKISECMTRDVCTIAPDRTLREAAEQMRKLDAGALPVGENDRLVGMITDRDIAVRGIADGKGPDAKVSEAMTCEVKYCFEDEDLEHVARNMGELQVRRLPVLSRAKRLVGIVSLGDLACKHSKTAVIGESLGEISRSGGAHNQSASATRH